MIDNQLEYGELFTCGYDRSDITKRICKLRKRTAKIQSRQQKTINFPQCLECGKNKKYQRVPIITLSATKHDKICGLCKTQFLGHNNSKFCRNCQLKKEAKKAKRATKKIMNHP